LFAAVRDILSGAHGPCMAVNVDESFFLREDASK
jgi:hypothetical protein